MTTPKTQALRALVEKATEAPWDHDSWEDPTGTGERYHAIRGPNRAGYRPCLCQPDDSEDARAIVAMRNHFAVMLDVVEAVGNLQTVVAIRHTDEPEYVVLWDALARFEAGE